MKPVRLFSFALATSLGVLGAGLLCAAPAAAQVYDMPPAPGTPHSVAIATPVEQPLPNGMRVFVAPRSGLPLVSVSLVVRTGSEADPADRAGLADMTAGLLTKGSKKRSAPQIAQAAEALGGSLDSGAGWHAASLSITVMPNKLDAALELMADVAQNPVFAQAELDRLRTQTLDALKVTLADPGRIAGIAAARAAFGPSVYGELSGGTPASIARITRADLQRMHASAWRPDNAFIVFAGDITARRAVALAATWFGEWKKPNTPLAVAKVAQAKSSAASTLVVDMPNAGQAGVVVAAPSIARNAPDYTIGVVTNTVLGGGYSSRLNQEVRIKRGLSYGAASRLDARRAGGLFAASAQTKNESAAEVATLMRGEIARLASEPVGADELAARKATLIGDFSRSFETTGGLAAGTAGLVLNDLPLDDLSHRIERYEAVTAQQVQAFAAEHWRAADLRTVIAGDARKFGDALRKTDPAARVLPQAQFKIDRTDLGLDTP